MFDRFESHAPRQRERSRYRHASPRWTLAIASAAIVLSTARFVLAQEPPAITGADATQPAPISPAAEAAALAQRNRGIELMHASNPAVAIEAFESSLSIVESPNTRLDLGRALIASGRLASGLRELERARDTAHSRIDNGQTQYVRTQQAAAEEADAVRPRVPHVDIRFSTQPPADTMVYIGTTRIPASALLSAVPIDPGPVDFRLSGPRVRETSVHHEVAAGETVTVVLEVVAGRSGDVPDTRATVTHPALPSRAAGWVLAGTGLVAFAGGILAWAAADSEYRALVAACANGPCTGAREVQRANTAQSLETLGVTLMVAGGIAAAAGVVIVLVRGHDRRDRVTASPWLAPQSAGLLVHF
jgi:hypothetical protein